MSLSASTVKNRSQLTAMRIGSIAAMSAISLIGLEVLMMTKEQFQREKLYQGTMMIARSLLKQGIISEDEYVQIDTIFAKKYEPSLGTLFADIDLINLESRANM